MLTRNKVSRKKSSESKRRDIDCSLQENKHRHRRGIVEKKIGIRLVFGKEIVNIYTSQIGLEEQEKRFLGNRDVIVHSICEKMIIGGD